MAGLRVPAPIPAPPLKRSQNIHPGKPSSAGHPVRGGNKGSWRQRGGDAIQAAGEDRGTDAAHDCSRGEERAAQETERGSTGREPANSRTDGSPRGAGVISVAADATGTAVR